MDDDLVFSWTYFLEFIILMCLMGVGLYFTHQTSLSDISKTYAEIAAVKGGFTQDDINNLKSDLASAGFDTSKLTITIQAFDINNINISSDAYPVTPFNASPYPSKPNFVPRGGKVILMISSSESTALNIIDKFTNNGSSTPVKHQIKRTFMSERTK